MKPSAQIFSLASVPPKKPRRRERRWAVTKSLLNVFHKSIAWLRAQKLARSQRKLQLCDTVSLGEKRFAAVLEYEGHRFLIGGAAQSVQLLTTLRGTSFSKTPATRKSSKPEKPRP